MIGINTNLQSNLEFREMFFFKSNISTLIFYISISILKFKIYFNIDWNINIHWLKYQYSIPVLLGMSPNYDRVVRVCIVTIVIKKYYSNMRSIIIYNYWLFWRWIWVFIDLKNYILTEAKLKSICDFKGQ